MKKIVAVLGDATAEPGSEKYRIAFETGKMLVDNADAVIAIGGGAGTLSEIAFSWTLLRLIIAYRNIPGWGQKLADTRVDERIRYPEIPDDRVYGADTPEEVTAILREKIDLYTNSFDGISKYDPRVFSQ